MKKFIVILLLPFLCLSLAMAQVAKEKTKVKTEKADQILTVDTLGNIIVSGKVIGVSSDVVKKDDSTAQKKIDSLQKALIKPVKPGPESKPIDYANYYIYLAGFVLLFFLSRCSWLKNFLLSLHIPVIDSIIQRYFSDTSPFIKKIMLIAGTMSGIITVLLTQGLIPLGSVHDIFVNANIICLGLASFGLFTSNDPNLTGAKLSDKSYTDSQRMNSNGSLGQN